MLISMLILMWLIPTNYETTIFLFLPMKYYVSHLKTLGRSNIPFKYSNVKTSIRYFIRDLATNFIAGLINKQSFDHEIINYNKINLRKILHIIDHRKKIFHKKIYLIIFSFNSLFI